jgi:hypothetical protein
MLRKVNLIVAVLATLLVMAPNASSQTNVCNCANASLVGDTVGTRFGGGPVANRTVNAGVELPNAGPVLGAAGPSPRWNINYGSDTIRVDFLQQPATYGAGASFVFSSLDPQLAGCPPAFISGITVTTNKPTVPFNVVAAATFGPHTVTIPIAPSGGNLDWQPGEFILIKLNFACATPATQVDACCPPWNRDLMKDMLFYQGSGSISAPYTLKFVPSSQFNAQMSAYLTYLHSINPAITGITIDWRLHNQGTGSTASPPYGPQVGSTAYATWTISGGANPTLIPNPFFTLPTYPMLVGTWYTVHTGIYLENGQRFFLDTCANNDINVRIQVMNAKGVAANSGPVLEFSDGKKVIKSIPISESKQQQR